MRNNDLKKTAYKMILTDLDHTLLRSDGTVSEHTLDVLSKCRQNGAKLAIATARYWIGAERYIDLLKPDYEITTDGTLIHSEEECIYDCAFTEEETDLIVREILSRHPSAEITVASGKTVLWNSLHIAESERLHKATYCDYSKPVTCRGNKIAAWMTEKSIAEAIAEKMDCKLQCYRNEDLYAFLPKSSGKVEAIRALSEKSGISVSDFVAFGDDLNDIDMLRTCGTGVAVGNAIPEVKIVADHITLTNDEDGVAEFLNKRFE
ncbi:MAG: Cof-type HAD-IIB family hydrolase [Clostridiales bacterium]|nr:Cof-type HAD-IIB family hydrolase [Clostridiales bacterium]